MPLSPFWGSATTQLRPSGLGAWMYVSNCLIPRKPLEGSMLPASYALTDSIRACRFFGDFDRSCPYSPDVRNLMYNASGFELRAAVYNAIVAVGTGFPTRWADGEGAW